MAVVKIENLEDLLFLDKETEIIDQKIQSLTAPGENYGSLMLKVDVIIKSTKGIEELNLVAKMVPPNDFIQEVFNTQVTFRNEVGFYKIIVPLLQEFQKEHGVTKIIDFSPQYYGSRLNLADDVNRKVDSDAVLLMENLKHQNFVVFERTEGFDRDVAKIILEDLAQLHAVSLALKLQKPETFEKHIKPYLHQYIMPMKTYQHLKSGLRRIAENLDELKPFLDRIYKAFDYVLLEQSPREPFATIAHNDCWVNNNMIEMKDGKPVKNKMVDFQLCDFGSPAKDVLFFLFSSVKTDVLQESYDYFIKYYYGHFTSILKELRCDLEPFSFENFEKELDHEARYSQFGHLTFMLFPIFLKKENVSEVSEFSEENFVAGEKEVSDLHKEKLIFIVKEFVKRNWI